MRSTTWLLLLFLSCLLSFAEFRPVQLPAFASGDLDDQDAEYGAAKSPQSIPAFNPSALFKNPNVKDALLASPDLSLKTTGDAPILKAYHSSIALSALNPRVARNATADFECSDQNSTNYHVMCEQGPATCVYSFSLSFRGKEYDVGVVMKLGCSDHPAGIVLSTTNDSSLDAYNKPQFIVYCDTSMCNKKTDTPIDDIATRFGNGEFARKTTPEPATSETTTNGGAKKNESEGGAGWYMWIVYGAVVIFVVLGVALGCFLWRRYKKKKEEEERKKKEEEERKKKEEEERKKKEEEEKKKKEAEKPNQFRIMAKDVRYGGAIVTEGIDSDADLSGVVQGADEKTVSIKTLKMNKDFNVIFHVKAKTEEKGNAKKK